jgi:hypothetical protein
MDKSTKPDPEPGFTLWWDTSGSDFCHGLNLREAAMAGWRARNAEVERWRAAWAKWRPGMENVRDFYSKDGNEPQAKAYTALLRDFDKCRES